MLDATWILLILASLLFIWLLTTQKTATYRNYPRYRPYPQELGDPIFDGWEWYWYQKRRTEGVRKDGPNYLCPGCDPKLTSPKFNCWENIAQN